MVITTAVQIAPLNPVHILTKKAHDLSITHAAAMTLINAAAYLEDEKQRAIADAATVEYYRGRMMQNIEGPIA